MRALETQDDFDIAEDLLREIMADDECFIDEDTDHNKAVFENEEEAINFFLDNLAPREIAGRRRKEWMERYGLEVAEEYGLFTKKIYETDALVALW